MHELGLVSHICKQLTDVGRERDLMQIKSVTLEIGEVSGIETHYLESCWKWTVAKPEAGILQGAELVCEPIGAVTVCEDCRKTYRTVEHGKTCPYCGSTHTFLVSGNEFTIKEIEAR